MLGRRRLGTRLRTLAGPGQGEAIAAWVLWLAITVAVLVTYSRIEPAELYNVSHEGLEGGLSRAVTLVNFPIALAAVALGLVAVASLAPRAWLVATPAIALCATVPWVVDQDDLDARWVHALPATGVLLIAALTVAAARAAGASFAPRLPGDPLRAGAAVAVVLVSLPWVTAEVGYHFPGDFFLGEELGVEKDGRTIAAVHLGHHHGTDGALLVLTALLLTRVRVPQRVVEVLLAGYLGLMLAYGGVNMVQDAWHEQLVKRGWTELDIPSALLPGLRPIWLVIVVLAALSTAAVLVEKRVS